MKKYQIIYADPPWNYRMRFDGKMGSRGKGRDYNTLSIEDICNIPINGIADNNCALFLWATYPCIKEALEVVERWGFEYKTVAFTWVKRNRKNHLTWFWGSGFYTRANAEICLLGIKRKMERKSKSVHQIIECAVCSHSDKPDEVKYRITQLFGDLPRIELFSRRNLMFEDGWDVWGNEVESDIQIGGY